MWVLRICNRSRHVDIIGMYYEISVKQNGNCILIVIDTISRGEADVNEILAQIIHSCKCGLYVGQRDHWSPKVHVLNPGQVECVLRDHVQLGLVLKI